MTVVSDAAGTRVVLGVDSSTQSTKVEVRDLDTGALLGRASAPHPPTTPPVSEQSPLAWWDALVDACTQLGDLRHSVVSISVGGQQHGLVLTDEAGLPVRPAKLWNDTTSAPQADQLLADLGAQALADATGSLPVAAFTVTKLFWVAQNEPALLDQVARVMLPHDYLTWRLSGRHVTDRGDASGSGWYSADSGSYLPRMLDAIGLAGDTWVQRLPDVLGPSETAGTLTDEAAAALGLPAGVLVGPGTGDNMAAALGLGLAPGDVALSLGTSGVVYAVSARSTHDASGAVAGFADATGNFLPLVCTLNATKVTDTVAAWLGTDPAGLAELAMQAPQATPGPVLVPYFDGERTPNLPHASGTFSGLRTDTTREQLALGAHDGVLCGLFDGIDALRRAGVAADGGLYLLGGGARSVAYRQRCADLWQAPIVVPEIDEAVATGAAVQAAVMVAGGSFAECQQRWGLGGGQYVAPNAQVDAPALRDSYRAAAD